ncbi:MAG: zinc-binding dehydrogenase, partial [Thermodesulfovibrionales bacterium]
DMVEFRLKKALEFGADHVVDVKRENIFERIKDLTDGKGAEIVIVGPNSVEAMMTGLRAVSRGGSVVLFTPARPGEILKIDPNEIYFKDINIVTSYSCGPDDTIMAMKFIEQGIISASKLVTHRFTIDETEKAFRITAEAKDSLKCIIVF